MKTKRDRKNMPNPVPMALKTGGGRFFEEAFWMGSGRVGVGGRGGYSEERKGRERRERRGKKGKRWIDVRET